MPRHAPRSKAPWIALWDGLGQGSGFVLGLLSLGIVRELLGAGSLFGWSVMPDCLAQLDHHGPAARRLFDTGGADRIGELVHPEGALER